MKIRVTHECNLTPFGAHYVITSDHQVVTGFKPEHSGEDGEPKQYVALNLNAITEMLVNHMGKFETGGGIQEIDGFRVPAKVAARFYIDAINGVLDAAGIRADLSKIRKDLCSTCIGSQAPAREFSAGGPAIMDMSHPQPEAGPATIIDNPVGENT